MFTGFYPRIYKHNINPTDWYPNYIQTYLEKDVREIANVKKLMTFKRFLDLCAGRHGQILDITQLANDWLSILEASFLIYLLQPFHVNYNKRLIKTPKPYFYISMTVN